jgi:O-6-methylguanine DNA methyltransferase
MYTDYLQTPAGVIKIEATDDSLLSVQFTHAAGKSRPNAVTKACAMQLAEYFAGKRTVFDLPLHIDGTPFQRSVWRALAAIPYGETRSYQDIAVSVGSPRGVRAVGGANARNRFTIVIPCHRVIQKDGKIGGYGGGTARKKFLLSHEAACKNAE